MKAIATLHDARRTEMFVVTVRDGVLVTSEYYESVESSDAVFLQTVPWESSLPPDAAPFMATGGWRLDDLDQAWIGWRRADAIGALALSHEEPLVVSVDVETTFVPVPIVGKSGALHLYCFAGGGVSRHEFRAAEGQPAEHRVVSLVSDVTPARVSVAVPLVHDLEDGALVGWVEPLDGGVRLACAIVRGGDVEVKRTAPLPDVVVPPGSRLGIHVAHETERTLGLVVPDGDGYALLEAVFVTGADARIVRTPIPGAAAPLNATAVIYPMRAVRGGIACLLDAEGTVMLRRGDAMRVVGRDRDPDYDFPIIATQQALHEVRVDAAGQVEVVRI